MHAQNLGAYFMTPPIWLAATLPLLIALLAWRLRWLSTSGAVSACIMGFLIFWLGGGKAILPLLAFFVSSSLLSKLTRYSRNLRDRKELREKSAAFETLSEKGSTRDASQVWANGGVAVAILLLHRACVLAGIPSYRLEGFPILFLASLATVNADTWATELGRLAGQTPRSLRDFRRVAPGTSGAITPVGTLAALGGAFVVPLSVYSLWPLGPAQLVAAAWAGFLGSLIDSLLGASLQAQFRHPETGMPTERRFIDGQPTVHYRGLRWMNNDLVNFLSSLGGTLCSLYLLHYAHLA